MPTGPGLSGSLPPEWGSPGAWQNLQHLVIANTQGGISGAKATICASWTLHVKQLCTEAELGCTLTQWIELVAVAQHLSQDTL